jgi:hypothetical protein
MVRHYFRWIGMSLVAGVIALASVPAQAQLVCDGHDDLAAWLAETFREQRVGYGVAGTAMIVELFASPRGTWTMLLTDVNGRSCIVAAGEGWEVEVATLGQGA